VFPCQKSTHLLVVAEASAITKLSKSSAVRKTEAEREAVRAKREAERARIAQYYQNPDQVLTFAEWCLVNTLSEASGRRIFASAAGPIVTELDPRRLGVTVGNNRAWQASRARGA
jgi:hypothetical protein